MEVQYDPIQKELIYNRKLKDGSGSKYYGLEVCKSMYMKPEFLEEHMNYVRAISGRISHY